MFTQRINTMFAAVFFCMGGWVYADQALGADNAFVITEESVESSLLADAAPDADAADAEDETRSDIKTGAFGKIEIHVKNLDISKVLQLLSFQSKRNIVASRNVSGTITADLYDVDFYEALDAILRPNGLAFREQGNFIYVYTQAELAEIEKQSRKTVSQVVKLNYLRASDASTFISPMLSSSGSIAVSADAQPGMQPSVAEGGADTNALGNILIIRDYAENIAEILDIITQVDVRPKQVLIEATILRVELNEDNKFGVDFSIIIDEDFASFTNPLSTFGQLIGGAVGPSAGTVVSQVGATNADPSRGFKMGVVKNDFAVFINALAEVRDTTVVSRPKLLVLNRQRAHLLVGRRDGYITSQTTDTATTQSVEFLESGTQLIVRPFVSDDGFVRLELQPSISDGTVSLLGTQLVPNEVTQELTTNVLVRSGQMVVLGGLFEESTEVGRRRVPFLGDVPVLGAAFRGQDDTILRNEYIFMVKPTVIKDEQLAIGGKRAMESVELARIGARQGVLPWSRDKMTQHHLRMAMDSLEAGDVDRARVYTDWALMLDPNFIQARRLQDQITGNRTFHHEHSKLQDAVDLMINAKLDNAVHDGETVDDLNDQVGQAQPQQSEAEATAQADDQPAATQPQQAEAGTQDADAALTLEAEAAEVEADAAQADADTPQQSKDAITAEDWLDILIEGPGDATVEVEDTTLED